MPLRRFSRKAGRVVRHVDKDGTVREYRYPAWKPSKRQRYAADTVAALIIAWNNSPAWSKLAPLTIRNYNHHLKRLAAIGHLEAANVKRRDILTLRDAVAKKYGPASADVFVRTTGALFTWAIRQGHVEQSPVFKIESLTRHRHLPAWSPADADKALAELPEDLRRVVVLALHTGQRRSDLCTMRWDAYDGSWIRLRQQKTGAKLEIPVSPTLRVELEQWRRTATAVTILTEDGKPWNPARLTGRLPRALAKIDGLSPHLNVHGLRKLAAANLASAGCTMHEIAAITGHRTLQMVQMYTQSADQKRLASAAIHKLTTNFELQIPQKLQKPLK